MVTSAVGKVLLLMVVRAAGRVTSANAVPMWVTESGMVNSVSEAAFPMEASEAGRMS